MMELVQQLTQDLGIDEGQSKGEDLVKNILAGALK